MSDDMIADDEVLYRRIPLGKNWFEPPDRIASGNFKLKDDELGISVYRAAIVNLANVLNRPEVKHECKVAATTAGRIRAVNNADGKSLNLDVVPVNDENDPGHSEIRFRDPTTGEIVSGKISKSVAKAIRDCFKLI